MGFLQSMHLPENFGGPRQSCPVDEQCSTWIFNYLGDCVCNLKDGFSFALGLLSVLSWGVAEIPQIMTNFFAGSTEGVSLTFLMTWTFGDFFNLAGCYLEPATLPTQFYMALLYTITTLILVGQAFYYDVFAPHKKEHVKRLDEEEEGQAPLLAPPPPPPAGRTQEATPSAPVAVATPSMSVPISRKSSAKDIYITSARSLASSFTPTMGSFVPGSSHGHGGHSLLSQSPGHPGHGQPHVSLTGGVPSRRDSTDRGSAHGGVVRAMAFGALLFSGLRLGSEIDWVTRGDSLPASVASSSATSSMAAQPFVFSRSVGRRRLLLAASEAQVRASKDSIRLWDPSSSDAFTPLKEGGGSFWGQVMGWAMATIYMGGRLPQIWLNIKRGTVEGLSPLMFLFALTGNVTYVGSILVRSLEWSALQPNMAWLVDAAVCVVLDMLILFQFVYYSIRKEPEIAEDGEAEEAVVDLK
eukprot:TRINITY_DN29524_c0_g1_i1.p1 TRINITY_DN29524_c0_g1~~TRINITY_DN29524_c0_g1_i1.p1  ORF type:complete len:468 (+),score=85.87 TRINITY_DN29524_c0_g1_i1:207-1610(+)